MQIGTIGNFYGNLQVYEKDGNYFWRIDDHSYFSKDNKREQEITKELYDALVKFQSDSIPNICPFCASKVHRDNKNIYDCGTRLDGTYRADNCRMITTTFENGIMHQLSQQETIDMRNNINKG